MKSAIATKSKVLKPCYPMLGIVILIFFVPVRIGCDGTYCCAPAIMPKIPAIIPVVYVSSSSVSTFLNRESRCSAYKNITFGRNKC